MPTPRHIVTKMPKSSAVQSLFKQEKKIVTSKGDPIRLPADFLSRNVVGQKDVAWYRHSAEREKTLQPRISGKAIIQNRRGGKKNLPRPTKEFITTKAALQETQKGIDSLSGKERPWAGVRKVGSTKEIIVNISIKIHQWIHKIKRY